MTVIDRLNRRGESSKQVIIGPSELRGPTAGKGRGTFSSVTRITAPVDLYEITDGLGANEGAYTIRIRPYSERGMRPSLSGLGKVAVILQPNGVNSPSAAPVLVGMKAPPDRHTGISIGPVSISTNDRLYIAVERRDQSTIKYQLEVDLILDAISITSQPANSSVTAPTAASFTVIGTSNDGGLLSYQWRVSADQGNSYSSLTDGGVFSGTTSATLTIVNTTALDGYRFLVVLSSSGGAPSLASNAATLTVAPDPWTEAFTDWVAQNYGWPDAISLDWWAA